MLIGEQHSASASYLWSRTLSLTDVCAAEMYAAVRALAAQEALCFLRIGMY